MRLRPVVAVLTTVLCGLTVLTSSDVASAYWTTTSLGDGRGAAAATTVGAGTRPTASRTGADVSLTWAASTLASGPAVSGYLVTRYDAQTQATYDGGAGCAGVVAATSCTETAVPDGSWTYTVTPVVGVSWRGAESPASTAVQVDVTAPGSSLSLTAVTGGAHLDGTTVYYQGAAAGSFRIANAVTDPTSGPASSRTQALGGTTTGWSHTPSTVTTPAGGPYTSAVFTWTAGTSSTPTETVVATDAAGNTTSTTLTFVSDTNAPTGTISYADGFSSGRNVAVGHTATANGAPISSTQLQRARASLKNGACGTFGGFANVGPVNPPSPYSDGPSVAGACYLYRAVITDAVGNTATVTGTNVARVGYAGAVRVTAGLVSYWRFGENAATSTDSFSGTTGVALQDRDGETGATWTRHPAATADAVLTASGRIRKEGTTTSALAHGSGVPASTDYRVSADVTAASVIAGDRAGVVGRLDPTATTYYAAAYDIAAGAWQLTSTVTGTTTLLSSSTQAFPAGTTRRVALDLAGSTIRVLVDGTQVVSVADTTITTAGRAGVVLGGTTVTTLSDATGLQLDNYLVGPVEAVPASADATGQNPGTYVGGVALGQAGVLAGDTDTAARFDGADDHMQVTTPTGLPTGGSPRTVQLWFKTTAPTRQVLYSYGSRATDAEFALWLGANGTSLTAWGFGAGDRTFTAAAALNDGVWHQAVTTYDGANLAVWIDGTRIGTQPATRATVVDGYGLAVGAVLTPGDSNSGGHFDGVLDEVAIYDTALPAATITDHYALANPHQDVDGPTGGSVDGTNLVGTGGRYRNTTSVTLGLVKGNDPSGVAATGAVLQRASATLAANSCGAFGAYTQVAVDPAASYANAVTTSTCYRYRYVVPDTLGNTTAYASPTIKVDTTAPGTPAAVAGSAYSSTYVASSVVYYRAAAASGSVTLTSTPTTTAGADADSGVASWNYPALGTGWTSTPGANPHVRTYSWAAATPTAPGAKTLTVTNNAGTSSATRTVTFTNDASTPTGGAISYADGRTTSNVPLTLTLGSDTGSGITATKAIQASTAPVTGGVCGTFGAFTQIGTTTSTATSTTTTPTLAVDTCYRFQYVVTDRVGNAATYTNPNVVRRAAAYATAVTGTPGITDYWRLGESSGATTAGDTVGANNNGTYQSTPTLGAAGALIADANTAATFDGTSQYVTMNRGVSGTFSLELWVRSTQSGGGSGPQWWNGPALIDADVSGVANDFGVALHDDGRFVAGVGTAGGTDTSISSPAGYADGQWHHVVFTRTQGSGALVLYVDGTQVQTGTGGTTALTSSATLNLARSVTGGRHFAGSLDEVATYTTALTPAQVAAHYNAAR